MRGALARRLPAGTWLRAGAAVVALVACLAMFAAPGQGAFPGANGRIAFVSARDGNQEIYTMAPDGSGQTRLTNDPEINSAPVWSPDGTRIAFEQHFGRNGLGSSIAVMNADGTGQTTISPGGGRDTSPTWSPDGTKIAFVRSAETEEAIFVINADGTGETRITSRELDDSPVWSPDGQRIVLSRYNSELRSIDIAVINADGTGATRLTNDAVSDQTPTWSPDGTKIAFISNRDDASTYSIYTMNADGSGITRLTTDSAQSPAWSPDGTKIVFSRGSQLWTMDPDGSNQVQLISEGGFSPDWQRVEPPPATLPPPVLGESVNVSAASGIVLVQTPGETAFTTLAQARQIKVGSRLDTKKGVVRLESAADAAGHTQTGDFGRGVFQVAQSKTAKGLTDLNLKGGNFGPCKKTSAKKGSAAAKKRKLKKKSIRSLFSNAKGKFRTRGRYSAASVRGTTWLVTDRCDGTLTTVKSGTVSVFDFKRKKTVKVKAGKSYLARAKR